MEEEDMLGLFQKLFKKPKPKSVRTKRQQDNKYDITRYLDDVLQIKLNYEYVVSSSDKHMKYALSNAPVMEKEKVNSDIKELLRISPCGIIALNFNGEDVRPLLEANLQKCIFYSFNNDVIFINAKKCRYYKNGSIEAWVNSTLPVPLTMLAYDSYGNINAYMFGAKEQSVKQVAHSESDIALVGEYFGVIYQDGDLKMGQCIVPTTIQ